MGPAGTGKTALVAEFLGSYPHLQPLWINASDPATTDELVEELLEELRRDTAKRVIVVLDAVERVGHRLGDYLTKISNRKRVKSLIVTCRALTTPYPRDQVHLGGLDAIESLNLLSQLSPRYVPASELHTLAKKVLGIPFALIMVANLLKEQTVEQVLLQLDGGWVEQVLTQLEEGWHDLDLPPITETQIRVVAPQIIIANDSVIQKLKRFPEDLHKVSPRAFEQLIADLLVNMGWEIQLTPESKDGGKDIIALLKTDLGRILCLVETKRYSPARPVQVAIVRQLYGTLLDHGASSAMLVTSSHFTKGAKEFQSKHQYQLSLKEYADIIKWIQMYRKK